jgi:hypothetical protein
MTTPEIIAMIGLVVATVALIFNGIQTNRSARLLQLNIEESKRSGERLLLDQQLARGNAVIHFTGRFFDLLKESTQKELLDMLTDENWAYQFWSLHATEFFFFQHGILPTFMYSLWMIDLAKVYCCPNGEAIRKSHIKYLQTYSFNYQPMIEFFTAIQNTAIQHLDENLRNREVGDYVEKWIEKNKKLFDM